MRKTTTLLATMVAVTAMTAATALAATQVTEDNLGDDWNTVALDADASFAFVEGPATPPAGIGSLQLAAEDLGADKITFVTNDLDGTAIADLTELSYSTYRDSSSTTAGHIVPSINIFLTNAGPDGTVTWAPLVFEPLYSYGAGAIVNDTWQQWDTMAPTQTGFAGGWWSTQTLGEICSFDCFVSWDTVLDNNPDATIIVAPAEAGSFGVNLGRGPGGSFLGNVDALNVTVDGQDISYDFEPKTLEKGDCKGGGWEQLTDSDGNAFVNQGDCVSYFASDGKTRGPRR